jgi:hypothetical protein
MKLVGHEEGRSLQLISMDEVRPVRGGVYPIEALSKIIAKYKFVNYPKVYEPNTTLKFETGVAEVSTTQIPILALEIYSDGLLISTRNTDDSDLVLDQFIEWSVQEFGFREPMTIVPRRYVSKMVVDIDGEFDNLSASFRVLGAVAARSFNVPTESLSIVNLTVGPYPPPQYPYQTTWQFFRRVVEPLVPNRYLSTAPLPSSGHYDFLVNLENALRRI